MLSATVLFDDSIAVLPHHERTVVERDSQLRTSRCGCFGRRVSHPTHTHPYTREPVSADDKDAALVREHIFREVAVPAAGAQAGGDARRRLYLAPATSVWQRVAGGDGEQSARSFVGTPV